MTHVSHVTEEEQRSETATAVFDAVETQLGAVPNLARVMAHSDAVLDGFIGTEGELLTTGTLGHELLEKVGLAVSAVNDCQYCVNAHSLSLLRNVDATDDEIEAITTGEFDALDERERVACGFAGAAARDPQNVPDDRTAELTDTFDDEEIVEIVGTAALFQGLNLFADALDVDLDEM